MVELYIAPEPKHLSDSDQGCELTSPSIAVGVLVEFKGMEWSSAHIPTTEVPSSPHILLSVARLHLGPAGSLLLLRLQPRHALSRVDLAPTPTLLLPLTPASTIEHSDSPGSLGPSAPPESDFAKPPLRTCVH
ncbi:hypothetical protein DPX16_21398 [Anabarilius grahami]|uniref:Uncharacterized protein n=1 Tax=Anabarilius grahami TaxID=495550 RepID=A0A3N0XUP2_ANAGA|nr:hypothetical protein DPX16_21398 [Anabarilius grahami]